MKKVFALAIVAGVMAFASCKKSEEATTTEAPVEATVDTTAAPMATDSAAAAPVDSAAAAPAEVK